LESPATTFFDVAFAYLVAQRRGTLEGVDFEMLIGMAPDQADAVRETVGNLILYTPVVHPKEFDAAVGYLVRRLDENASPENFMSAVFDLHDNAELFVREEQRFRASLKALTAKAPEYRRVQNQGDFRASDRKPADTFHNEPDTDPSLAANRAWAQAIRQLATSSEAKNLGVGSLAKAEIPESLGPIKGGIAVDDLVARGRKAGALWGKRPASERATILLAAADQLNKRRNEFLAVMMQEAGKTLLEGDPELSEAVDFARYYARSALELEKVDGARFQPAQFTLVTPPWNFPVAIPAGSVLAALAAGSDRGYQAGSASPTLWRSYRRSPLGCGCPQRCAPARRHRRRAYRSWPDLTPWRGSTDSHGSVRNGQVVSIMAGRFAAAGRNQR